MHSYSDKSKDTSRKNESHHQDSSFSMQHQTHFDQSPQVKNGAAVQAMVDNSPNQIAQRKKLDGLFGGAVVQNKKEEEKKPIQKKGNHTGLPDALKEGTEKLSGMPMDDVHVHYNSSKPKDINAHAYAQGTNIHLGPGQEKHLPHEAWHVVQQKQGRVEETTQLKGIKVNDSRHLEKEADEMGSKALRGKAGNAAQKQTHYSQSNVVQGYFETLHNSADYRVADDLSSAVQVGYPNHILYAKPGKAKSATAKLKAVGSGIELYETSAKGIFTSDDGKKMATLTQVLPKNNLNNTKGDKMKLWADCGKSNSVVVGDSDRKAKYKDPSTGKAAFTGGNSPAGMKIEIMKAWLNKTYSDVKTDKDTRSKVKKVLDGAKPIEAKLSKLISDYGKAKTDPERESIATSYTTTQDALAEKIFSYYNSLSSSSKYKIDKELAINRYANPHVGEGYTTSSGGAPIPGKSTWNFHWGGVVMESSDLKDKITLENYAVGIPDEQNTKWDFAMYGTVKKGQSFHSQHKATELHGTSPTTMNILKK